MPFDVFYRLIDRLVDRARWEGSTLFKGIEALAIRGVAVTLAFTISFLTIHLGQDFDIVDLFSPFASANRAGDLRSAVVAVVGMAALSGATTAFDVLDGRGDDHWLRTARVFIRILIACVVVLVIVSLNQIYAVLEKFSWLPRVFHRRFRGCSELSTTLGPICCWPPTAAGAIWPGVAQPDRQDRSFLDDH